MSNARNAAQKAIAIINRTPAGIAKASALSELLNGVSAFVESAKAGADLTRDISTLETELAELNTKLRNPEIEKSESKKLEGEVKETQSTLNSANQARRQVDKNRGILLSLKRDVERLRSEISQAL